MGFHDKTRLKKLVIELDRVNVSLSLSEIVLFLPQPYPMLCLFEFRI